MTYLLSTLFFNTSLRLYMSLSIRVYLFDRYILPSSNVSFDLKTSSSCQKNQYNVSIPDFAFSTFSGTVST